jgi:hypothetical protein
MSFMSRPRSIQFCVLLMLFGSAIAGWGQSLNGSLSGRVTDPSNASVPAATITIQNTGTGVSQTFTTGPTGIYTFPNLLRGTYNLTVDARGFRKYEQVGITIDLNARVTQDVTLAVGAPMQVVEVLANASPLNYESGVISETVPPSTIEDLPLTLSGAARNAAQFVELVPGVATGAQEGITNMRFAGGPASGDDSVLDGSTLMEGLA